MTPAPNPSASPDRGAARLAELCAALDPAAGCRAMKMAGGAPLGVRAVAFGLVPEPRVRARPDPNVLVSALISPASSATC